MRVFKNKLLASLDIHHTYECFYQISKENIVTVRCANLMDLEDIYSTGIDILFGANPKLHLKPIPRKSIITDPSDYIEIPGRYYIYVEKCLLSHFCKSIEDTNISASLLLILKHRNKDNSDKFIRTLRTLNLEDRLISFKESFNLSIALNWCKINNIQMIE